MSLYAAARAWADNHPEHVGPPGFAVRGYAWTIALSADGLQVAVTRAGEGTNSEKAILPDQGRSGTKPPPFLVHDNVSHLLGRYVDRGRGLVEYPERPPLYRELLVECAQATGDPLVGAVLRWFDNGPSIPEFEALGNETFRVTVDGRDPVEPSSPAGRWWSVRAERNDGAGGVSTCMVCGTIGPVSRLIPQVKGIEGAKSSGASLTSINEDVFASYGATTDTPFDICPTCAHATSTALNYFTATADHHIKLAGTTVIWWQPERSEPFDLGAVLTVEDGPEMIRHRMSRRRTGRTTSRTSAPERFCAAILTGNSGRTSITGWIDTTIPDIEGRLDRYFARAKMADAAGGPRPPTFYQLARASLADNATKLKWEPARRLVAAILGDVLAGSERPPAGLAVGILNRTRTGNVTHARAAALKLSLCPSDHPNPEAFMTELDPAEPSAAYQCGRLLATVEHIQFDALGGTNSTVVDKYYGTFSSRPNVVFSQLVKGAQPHLAKLRKDETKRGFAVNHERRLGEIIASIDTVPSTLTLEQQAEFALGYYHQRQARFTPKGGQKRPGDEAQTDTDQPTEEDSK